MQILCREISSEDEEERLSQMIRDFIELGSSSTNNHMNPSSYFSSSNISLDHVVDHHFISLQEILENVSVSEAEIFDKIWVYLREECSSEAGKNDDQLKKWITVKLGSVDHHHYQASLCTTSWFTPPWFTSSSFTNSSEVFKTRNEYKYIEVNPMINEREVAAAGGRRRLIIDIDFRTQFDLVRPTEKYKRLWNCLPDIFVGTEEKIIKLVCKAAKESLRESGLHIPPWRKTAYMHSKWLSQNCKKISSSDLASPNL